jgi:hypothetical protein
MLRRKRCVLVYAAVAEEKRVDHGGFYRNCAK